MRRRRLAGGAIAVASACLIAAGCGGGGASSGSGGSSSSSSGGGGKKKVFVAMSYSGNAWQDEASNLALSIARTPPYDKTIDVRREISGTEVQAQISQYQLPGLPDRPEPGHQGGVPEGRHLRDVRRDGHRAVRVQRVLHHRPAVDGRPGPGRAEDPVHGVRRHDVAG
jgi:hypothetical protein